MQQSRKIKTLFYRLYQQQHRCFYCGCDLSAADAEITLDHVQPAHLGWICPRAVDTPENVVAACVSCNTKKAGRTPTADEETRLAALNAWYSVSDADAHYRSMLRVSRHSLKLMDICGIKI